MQQREKGFSLTEFLLVMTISIILASQLNLGSFATASKENKADELMTGIVTAISMARQAAVNESRMVTFCRSDDGKHCQGKWHEGSIIFTDRNADHVLNEDDRLLYRLPATTLTGSLRFSSFGNKQYLQLTPFGLTNYQNGNFTWCPENKDPTFARQVIVSMTGRTRYARDEDGDGIIENSQGKAVECK